MGQAVRFSVQMKPIAIFYHCILSGGSVPIDTSFACSIVAEQMDAFRLSGLFDEADELHIGLNGDEEDLQMLRLFVPCPHAHFLIHGSGMTTEIPTLAALQRWLPIHRDWFVLYAHIKGVSHPGRRLDENWRRRMERAVVWNWKRCVNDLRRVDAVGCHWLTPEQYAGSVKRPFFGGNFWWARAEYLADASPAAKGDLGESV